MVIDRNRRSQFAGAMSDYVICARVRRVSVERFAGRTSDAGLKDSQITKATPCLAASRSRCEWIDAENEVMTMAATSSSGSDFAGSPSTRQVS